MSSPLTGKKIGNYRIGEQIGGGAMGRVWRGVDEALGRPVAVKMLRTELADRPELIERFRIEARILARLSHPNIAMVYALEEDTGDLYLVLEYVKGETLDTHLERQGPLDLGACFTLFHQALDGIQHAHEAGVVHHDIKLSNLMLDPTGQLKWIDFGIALVHGRERTAKPGALMGTPEYMAPEQVRGELGTIRSDVYALGIVLYRMLTGQRPFTGDDESAVMRAQLEAEAPSPREHGIELEEDLEAVLLQALVKDPVGRFQSVGAFQQALIEAGAPEPSFHPAVAESSASEITLFDREPMIPDADEGALEPTRPDLDYDDVGFDEEPETAPDGAPVEEAPKRSRAGVWIGATILVAGLAAGAAWFAISGGTLQPEPRPAATQVPVQSEPTVVPPPIAEQTPAEPAEPEATPPAEPGATNAEGWEIVR